MFFVLKGVWKKLVNLKGLEMFGELQTRDSVNQYNFFSKYSIRKKDIESNIVSNEDEIIYTQGIVNSLRLNSWQHSRKLKEALITGAHTLWFSSRPIYKDRPGVWRRTTPSKACSPHLVESTLLKNKDVSRLQWGFHLVKGLKWSFPFFGGVLKMTQVFFTLQFKRWLIMIIRVENCSRIEDRTLKGKISAQIQHKAL